MPWTAIGPSQVTQAKGWGGAWAVIGMKSDLSLWIGRQAFHFTLIWPLKEGRYFIMPVATFPLLPLLPSLPSVRWTAPVQTTGESSVFFLSSQRQLRLPMDESEGEGGRGKKATGKTRVRRTLRKKREIKPATSIVPVKATSHQFLERCQHRMRQWWGWVGAKQQLISTMLFPALLLVSENIMYQTNRIC